MKIVIFGLAISSSWGNGHATIWRGLCRAFQKRGHKIVFFEKDVPYYANQRDLHELKDVKIILYRDWEDIAETSKQELADAEIGIVTSYCPDAVIASILLFYSNTSLKIFYDLDTPITIKALEENKTVPYIPAEGLSEFDLVLSYTGGAALKALKNKLGAKITAALYGCADPETHFPVPQVNDYLNDLSYLGTYSQDRQELLNRFFIKAAEKAPAKSFLIGGSMYPYDMNWSSNIRHIEHIAPPQHPPFYCSSGLTLNITRGTMAEMGYCPSGRLFEAAVCGVPILSDNWEGLDYFFKPGKEIIIINSTDDVLNAFELSEKETEEISISARENVLNYHTADKRVQEFENIINTVYQKETYGG